MKLKDFLSNGNVASSMRLTMIWAIILVSLIFIAIFVHILILSSKMNPKEIDWVGVATLVGALGVFISPFLYFKKEEKKIENL